MRGPTYAHYWPAFDGASIIAPTIDGRIGWHVTWAIAVDERGERLAFYETFQEDAWTQILFRVPLPNRLRATAEACGASYEGVLDALVDTWAYSQTEQASFFGGVTPGGLLPPTRGKVGRPVR